MGVGGVDNNFFFYKLLDLLFYFDGIFYVWRCCYDVFFSGSCVLGVRVYFFNLRI